uniref:Uncharacterized protein n=1 Tax=Rhizophora mucronata TaxID=61149 RepID=A0A2P2N5U2_RHIMU
MQKLNKLTYEARPKYSRLTNVLECKILVHPKIKFTRRGALDL